MDKKIELSYNEINALNKLLGSINSESLKDAGDLEHFSASPFIISLFEKVHTLYLEQNNVEVSFQMTSKHGIPGIKDRILKWNKSRKEWIRGITLKEREDYCQKMFAPFIPTENQRSEIMELLNSI